MTVDRELVATRVALHELPDIEAFVAAIVTRYVSDARS